MSSESVLATCSRLFRRHDRTMQSVAVLLRQARTLVARSQERLDGRGALLARKKEARRVIVQPRDQDPA
jgi:hypothetical protein